MLIAELFMIAKMWETTEISIDDWMDKENVMYVNVCLQWNITPVTEKKGNPASF